MSGLGPALGFEHTWFIQYMCWCLSHISSFTAWVSSFCSDLSWSVNLCIGLEVFPPSEDVRPVLGSSQRLHQRILRRGCVEADREPSRDSTPQVCQTSDVQVRRLVQGSLFLTLVVLSGRAYWSCSSLVSAPWQWQTSIIRQLLNYWPIWKQNVKNLVLLEHHFTCSQSLVC